MNEKSEITFSFQGTPFTCKVYDGKLVSVSGGSSARVGVPVQLAVDAAQAGEGNLEITVAARGLNIPTQVHPQVSPYHWICAIKQFFNVSFMTIMLTLLC